MLNLHHLKASCFWYVREGLQVFQLHQEHQYQFPYQINQTFSMQGQCYLVDL